MIAVALHPIVACIAATLFTLLAIASVNTFMLPRLSARRRLLDRASAPPVAPAAADGTPYISVLMPARDEADRIAPAIRDLLAQQAVDCEVLVLDDASSDGTAQVVRAAGRGDPRLRVLRGQPLPPGWAGKNWACHQLAQAARGTVLVFTDADVRWRAGALAALVAELNATGVDAVTVWPTQCTVTWGERLVVPLMAFAVLGYLPVGLVNHTNWPYTGAANGQCFAFRRRAYLACGGHAAVRHSVLDDVALARRLKRARLWLRMVDADGLLTCRMYDSWCAVLHGFAKNILAGHGDSVLFLALSIAFHWAVFVGPWLWLLLGWRWSVLPGWPLQPLALVLMGVGLRAVTAHATRQRVGDAWLMPISVLLMTRIALHALWWRVRYGGPRWKGRTIP